MNGYYEITHEEMVSSVKDGLVSSLSTEQLIAYMEKYHARVGLTHKMYDELTEMFINGDIKLVKSAWKNTPDSWRHLSKRPLFINKINYRKIELLRANKRDWDANWAEYYKKYPVRDENSNTAEFWSGEFCSRNAFLHINQTYYNTNLDFNNFQFMIEVTTERNNWSDYGQEYVFEFVGEDMKNKFVEYFRRFICSSIAKELVSMRHDQLLEEETKKTVALFGTIIDNEKEETK